MAYIYQSDYLRLREMKDDARDEGREEGREEERKHTEEQRKRADVAEAKLKEVEEELERLRKQIQ